jgi:hypothetical protein
VLVHSYEINANYGLTPAQPEGPLALPGRYRVRLTVDGRKYEQPLVVRNDPRSPVTAAELRAQHGLLQNLYHGIQAAWEGFQQVAALRAAVDRAVESGAAPEVIAAAQTLRASLDSVAGTAGGGGGGPGGPTFRSLNGALASLLTAQDNADHAPTAAMRAGYAAACRDLARVAARWERVAQSGLAAFNAVRTRQGLPALAGQLVRPPRCPGAGSGSAPKRP